MELFLERQILLSECQSAICQNARQEHTRSVVVRTHIRSVHKQFFVVQIRAHRRFYANDAKSVLGGLWIHFLRKFDPFL